MLQSSLGCLLVTCNRLLSSKMNRWNKYENIITVRHNLLSETSVPSPDDAASMHCWQKPVHRIIAKRFTELSNYQTQTASPYHICISLPHTEHKTDEILSPTLLLGAVLKRPNSKTATPCCDQQHLPRITGYGESSMPWSSSTRQLWFVSRYLKQKYSHTIRRMQTLQAEQQQ